MEDLSNIDFSLLKVPTEGSAFQNTVLGRGVPAGGTLKLDMPLDGITPDGKTAILAMASDCNGTDFARDKDYQIYVAITRDQVWPLSDAQSYGPYNQGGSSGSMPIIDVGGYLDGPGLTSVVPSASAYGTWLTAWAFGQPPLSFDFQVNASISNGAWEDVGDYHVDAIDSYELTLTNRHVDGSEIVTHTFAADGHFT